MSIYFYRALLGQMESCDADILEIGDDEVDKKISASEEQLTSKVETGTSLPSEPKALFETDYRVHLVERAQCATESDYDTDDLIEDANAFERQMDEDNAPPLHRLLAMEVRQRTFHGFLRFIPGQSDCVRVFA